MFSSTGLDRVTHKRALGAFAQAPDIPAKEVESFSFICHFDRNHNGYKRLGPRDHQSERQTTTVATTAATQGADDNELPNTNAENGEHIRRRQPDEPNLTTRQGNMPDYSRDTAELLLQSIRYTYSISYN